MGDWGMAGQIFEMKREEHTTQAGYGGTRAQGSKATRSNKRGKGLFQNKTQHAKVGRPKRHNGEAKKHIAGGYG